ncbi:class II aldolase/adducin family protein [Clostridium oceanicum]|uniref:Class II aldolase/adducin family protein n=1 Tax=Clostridium oceanicum TaxID=1543 RepID=A0ABP3UJY0_9CLOT
MLEDLKKRLVDIAKKADKEGLCKHKSGNFSIRDSKTGNIVVTPSGVSREDLTYEDICVVDINANLIEAKAKVKPTSELLMHLEVYKCRDDVMGIVHTHSKMATAFSVLNKEIPPIVYEVINVAGSNGTIPVAPYARPGTVKLSKSIINPIKKSDGCLMANHGALAVSNNIEDAFLKACYIEEVAEIYYSALMINKGAEPETIPLEELSKWKYPDEINLK